MDTNGHYTVIRLPDPEYDRRGSPPSGMIRALKCVHCGKRLDVIAKGRDMDSKKHMDFQRAVDAMRTLAESMRPYEGKYIRKLGQATRDNIKTWIEGANATMQGGPVRLLPQWLQGYSSTGAPIVCCGKLIRELEWCETKLTDMAKLAAVPEMATYLEAGNAFRNALQALRDAAAKVGILHLAGVAPIVQFPATDW